MGIKKNFLYSSILTVSNYIFPLITYPYVSRVLGVTNIGICNFVDSIINYFLLFSMMGIGTIGIREIAGSVNNHRQQSSVFSSLLMLNGISTLIMLLILLVSIYVIPQFYEHKELMYVGAMKLFANLFLVEWYFKGIENFKYITNRTILVKCFYVIAVFVFVKDANDYPIYFLLISLMTVVNAIINFLYACTKVKITIKGVMLRPYLKPFFIMGIYLLLTSIYVSLNVAILGFVSSFEQVGYYTTATRIFSIIIAIYTAFTGVMMPRLSVLYAEGKQDEFKLLIDKSVHLLFSLAIPAVIFTTIFAPEIIQIISGDGYEGAYLPTRIIIPLIFIIGYEQILVMQILLPSKQDKTVLRNSIYGVVSAIIFNLLLVKQYQAVGSSIVWLTSEITVFICASLAVKKLINFVFPLKLFLKQFIYYFPAIIILIFISCYDHIGLFSKTIVASAFMGIYMLVVLIYIEKNEMMLRMLSMLKSKFN